MCIFTIAIVQGAFGDDAFSGVRKRSQAFAGGPVDPRGAAFLAELLEESDRLFFLARPREGLASLNRSSPVVSTVAMMRMASSWVTFDGTLASTGGLGSVRMP